jgi:hypothetical protein
VRLKLTAGSDVWRQSAAQSTGCFTCDGAATSPGVAPPLLADTCGHEAVPTFRARASTNAGLDPRVATDALLANSRAGRIASCDGVRLQAPALEAVVGRGSPAWPSDLRNRPEGAVGERVSRWLLLAQRNSGAQARVAC